MVRKIIAHVRSNDKKEQTLEQHLTQVAEIAGRLASKIGMKEVGELLGLMHDFGKYSQQFQTYIQSGTGILNMDIDDDWVDAIALKGKIDHSTAGAQWVWKKLSNYGSSGQGKLCGQILALCIASHHSGLIDCLMPDGVDGFIKRMNKQDDKTNFEECSQTANKSILNTAHELADQQLIRLMIKQIKEFYSEKQHNQKISSKIMSFYLGFWTRFLFSCLIDADRIDSADFETPFFKSARNHEPPNWNIPIDRLEVFLNGLQIRNHIDFIRRDISDNCKNKAPGDQGIYSLSVPTGGGKTYASLRFALHHANKHKLDRIIYVIPYTSIIEQNAEAIRKVIERESDTQTWVLEHHSNLEPEQQTWRSKLVAENWDSPIIMTTMVQFLETLFGGGTRGVRRLHQLANSVIVFDEIQTLPIKCTHLFCNAINFLSAYTRTTVVLCTATQPLLDKLKSSEKGQLFIPKENELVLDKTKLFADLKRVKICNQVKNGGWNEKEILKLILDEFNQKGNCLVIVNTKNWAQKLFTICNEHVPKEIIIHLSTNQCPEHRKMLLKKIRTKLDNDLPLICISTQLIEAGVDVDFACVIRFLAGLDSIAQAAGRCNRNGRLVEATVHVINPVEENIDQLLDIKIGQEKALRVLDENRNGDLLSPDKIRLYFEYYFYARAEDMSYTLSEKQIGRTDNLLNLLSDNRLTYTQSSLLLKQSFMTAGRVFEAIDAQTDSIIVPFGEGKQIISQLCAVAKEFDASRYYRLLKNAQKYSVNIFPNVKQKLIQQQAIHEIQRGEGIYYLDETYYSDDFGLSTEIVSSAEILVC
ncbi:TPA: CRISPR-associated helicase Cas3' [Legionella pneumophila subsp. pneumophila]|nr:CRISPR-associated helicase Cas3' [Legionella pneumophila subsp. pneumophila]